MIRTTLTVVPPFYDLKFDITVLPTECENDRIRVTMNISNERHGMLTLNDYQRWLITANEMLAQDIVSTQVRLKTGNLSESDIRRLLIDLDSFRNILSST